VDQELLDMFSRRFDPEWERLEEVSYADAVVMIRAIIDDLGTGNTVRQIYYEGVRHSWWETDYVVKSREGEPKKKNDGKQKRNSFQRVSRWLTGMRTDGIVDYEEVIEYGRPVTTYRCWLTGEDFLRDVEKMFRIDLWAYQPSYVEVWTEGEAIMPIVAAALKGLRVVTTANKGNTSTTAIRKSAMRLLAAVERHVEIQYPDLYHDGLIDPDELASGLVHVLYVGDHDAAGANMDVNIVERLRVHGDRRGEDFSCDLYEYIDAGVVQFERIAVTLEQVDLYSLPPDSKPASKTSPTGKLYFERFGHRDTWAFEALPKRVAQDTIRDAVTELMDDDAWDRGDALEDAAIENMKKSGRLIG
jgi:hypothetical protein